MREEFGVRISASSMALRTSNGVSFHARAGLVDPPS
jgi:hypothetical protein